jgi:hypothetical protein
MPQASYYITIGRFIRLLIKLQLVEKNIPDAVDLYECCIRYIKTYEEKYGL